VGERTGGARDSIYRPAGRQMRYGAFLLGARMGSEMNLRYSIDKQRRFILTTAEGRVMFDDVRGHQDRLLADPDFDPSFDQLIDTTAVTKLDISADEVRTLGNRRIFSPKSRRAIVATEPYIFGLGRMMEIYHEGLKSADVHVFYSMDEALNWLERVEREEEKSWSGNG
jgi:hypothetical protein